MRDFTLHTLRELLSILKDQGYTFQPFAGFLKDPAPKCIILRHDVDARKMNSLNTARIENELEISGTYFFRTVPESFDEDVIKEISGLGHEIGYHYEDLSNAAQRQKKNPLLGGVRGGLNKRYKGTRVQRYKGNKEEEYLIHIAIESFKENLGRIRRIVPVNTICMHGNPLSRWDNRILWKYYDYRDFGIIGEPYFDINFNEVLYLTDTGRRWDGEAVSIRDKVQKGLRDLGTEGLRDGEGGGEGEKRRVGEAEIDKEVIVSETGNGRNEGSEHLIAPSPLLPFPPSSSFKLHTTFDIIDAAKTNRLPYRIMLNIHPQRWDDRAIPWIREIMWQNVKNIVKQVVVKNRRGEI